MSLFEKEFKLDKVIRAIDDGENLDADQRQSSKELVWVLAETYLQRDYDESKVLHIEESFSNPLVAGTIDLIQRIAKPIYLPKNKAGKKIIVDWKTTNSSTFDKAFRERYVNSWQWKIYCLYGQAELFEYRCISKTTGDTIELALEFSDDVRASVENQLKGMNLLVDSLININDVWPRHMPSGCNVYGKPCPFLEICTNNHYIPVKSIPLPLHYSTMETFLTCPERFRLAEGIKSDYGVEAKDTYETAIGSAVHRGMQEIYSQLMEKQIGKS